MSARLYGIDTGATMTVDLSNLVVSENLVDISELIIGGNIVIGLTNPQFTTILDIDTDGDEIGTVEFKEAGLKSLLASCIDRTNAGTTYELYSSGANVGGSVVGSNFPADGNGKLYNFLDFIKGVNNYITGDIGSRTVDEIAWRVAGLSEIEDLESYSSSSNLKEALSNSGIVPDVTAAIGEGSFLLGRDISASDYTGDSDRFNFTGATSEEKQRLFKSIIDAGYIDIGNGIGTGNDVSFDDGFALAIPLTLKGGVQVNISFANDTSFVDASTGDVVASSEAENLKGELNGLSFSFANTIVSNTITNSITDVEVLDRSGNVVNEAIRFNLLLVAKNS